MSKDISISNLWNLIQYSCGCIHNGEVCGEPLTMEMKHNGVFMVCPKCGASTSTYDVEKFMNKVATTIVEDAEDGIETNLTNFKHKLISRMDRKSHEFTVTSHTNKRMKVSIKND